jgi:dTMP kinase
VLSDVPAVPERVVELAVPITPKHVGQGLTDHRARRYRLGEHRLGIGDVKGRPTVVEEFSRRHTTTDPGGALGRHLLRALVDASGADPFLRGGLPRSETLLLLAIKIHDYEASLPTLRSGRTVIEGRSVHSVAVYQSLILEHDDARAAAVAQQILATATTLRPLPDLTVLVVDEPTTAVHRADLGENPPLK